MMKIINKLKKNKMARAGLGYTLGNILVRGIGFISIPIFTHLMTPDNFGLYNIYLAYESIILVIIGIALHSSIKNAYYEFGEEFSTYISSIVSLVVVNTVFCSIIFFLMKSSIVRFTGFNEMVIVCLLLQSFGSAIFSIYNVYLSLNYEYVTYVKISAINAALNIMISVILIKTYFADASYIGRIIGTSLPVVFTSIFICYIFYTKKAVFFDKKYWIYGIQYSLPIVPHGLSQILLSYFNRIIIQKYCGNFAAGIFSFSFLFNAIYLVLVNSLDNVWGPWFYERMSSGQYSKIKKRANDYICLMTFLMAVLLLICPELIVLIAPKSYNEAIFTAVPLLLSSYFMFLYTLPVQIEYYYKKTKMIAIGTFFASVINMALSLYFVPKYGYICAAYINLFSYIVYFCFHYLIAYKINGFLLYDTLNICLMAILICTIGSMTLLFLEELMIRYVLVIITIIIMALFSRKEIIV